VTDTIPQPLLDRMEVVRLSGYIHEEKFEIAKRYLIPTQMDNAGLKPVRLSLSSLSVSLSLLCFCVVCRTGSERVCAAAAAVQDAVVSIFSLIFLSRPCSGGTDANDRRSCRSRTPR
jgi:hypothetical protein